MGASVSIRIEYDRMPPAGLRGNSGFSRLQKQKPKRILQDHTLLLIRQENFKPIKGYAEVQYTVYHCDKPIDNDNLVTGMKYALDCFTDEGLIVDDGPDYIGIPKAIYHKVPHRNQVRLVMEIKECVK